MTRPGRRAVRAEGRVVAVVPAGGSGVRMKSRRPKQYLSLGGAPLLVHTLRALVEPEGIDGVVLVVPADRIAATRRLVHRHGMLGILDVVAGGVERQESVWRGLQAVPAGVAWVVVHDAVRPFVTRELVEQVLAAARRYGAATCGLEVRETVKRVRGEVVEATVDRERLWLIQTPQAFSRDLLCEAHDKARRDGFTGTDDAVLVERLGEPVAVVPGLAHNLKITTPADLQVARLWLTTSRGGVRGPVAGPRRRKLDEVGRRAGGPGMVRGPVAGPRRRKLDEVGRRAGRPGMVRGPVAGPRRRKLDEVGRRAGRPGMVRGPVAGPRRRKLDEVGRRAHGRDRISGPVPGPRPKDRRGEKAK